MPERNSLLTIPIRNLDDLGRNIAQHLCEHMDVESVTTYGVCADLVYVFMKDGQRFAIDISSTEEDGWAKPKESN